MHGVQVQSLIGELRSHLPRGQEKKNIKQKHIVEDSIKTLKMVHIKKIFLKFNNDWLSILTFPLANLHEDHMGKRKFKGKQEKLAVCTGWKNDEESDVMP